jgi:hypothetical protein
VETLKEEERASLPLMFPLLAFAEISEEAIKLSQSFLLLL